LYPPPTRISSARSAIIRSSSAIKILSTQSSGVATRSPAIAPNEVQGLGRNFSWDAAVQKHNLLLSPTQVARSHEQSLCNFDHVEKIAAGDSDSEAEEIEEETEQLVSSPNS
jgi:hypothetical protein